MNAKGWTKRAGAGLLALAAALTLSAPARAQESGAPLRILVGFPAGGTIDVVARLLADQLRADLGQPVIVESRPGAGGLLAAQAVKAAAPDGRTLLLSPDHTMVMLPLTTRTGDFQPADLAPVGQVARYAGGFGVAEKTGARTLPEFLQWAKANPGQANVGVPAAGSVPQFLTGLISQRSDVPLAVVPYRGSAPMVQDLLGGQVASGTTALGDFLEHPGRIRVVAVLGAERSPLLPDVPTLREQGHDVVWEYWIGLFAPGGAPAGEIARLNAAVGRALSRPEVQERMKRIVFEPAHGAPAALAERVRADAAYWAPIVKASGWTVQ
jgi:tripartite-type tricarboxylate transporter receptor subunit TctC